MVMDAGALHIIDQRGCEKDFTLLNFLEWKRDWAFSRNKCLARILDLLHLGITVSPHFQRIYPLPLKGVWFGFSNFPTEVK